MAKKSHFAQVAINKKSTRPKFKKASVFFGFWAKMSNFRPKKSQHATFALTLNGHNSAIFIRF